MEKNMGTVDRTLRSIVAVLVGVLLLTGALDGIPGITLGALAFAFLATSIVSSCPLYLPFRVSTRRKQ